MRRDRDRDAALDRMLAAELRTASGAAQDCPEAGDLAAFVEGGLSAPEREAIERHSAACGRCQQVLASVVSTLPGREVMARPEGHPAWALWLRWAIPVAGVAVVVLLYVGIRSTMMPSSPPEQALKVASKPGPAERAVAEQPPAVADNYAGSRYQPPARQPESPVLERRADTARRVADSKAPTRRGEVRPPAPAEPAPAPPDQLLKVAPMASRQAPGAAGGAGVGAGSQAGIAGNAALFRQQAVASPAAQQGVAQQAPTQQAQRNAPDRVQGIAGGVAGGVVGGLVEAPPPKGVGGEQISVAPKVVAETVQITAASTTRKPTLTVVATPGRSVLWRVEPNGTISRTRDGGSSWNVQSYRAQSPVFAGSAPADTVCWLVGSAGTVILTTDAERWEARPFPERVDLVAVDARDALHATVTARDGRRFVTDDGGLTWQPR